MLDPAAGTLRVGILPTVALYLLPDAVGRVRRSLPRPSLRWTEDRTAAGSRDPVRSAELDGVPVLLLEDGHCFREQALAFCSRAGAEELGFRATSLSTLAQMAAGGAGVALLPRLSVAVENRRGTLVVRPFAPPVPARTLALVWRPRSRLAAALRPLAAALGESLRRLAARS